MSGHHHVGDQQPQLPTMAFGQLYGLAAAARHKDAVSGPLEQRPGEIEDRRLIFNDEYRRLSVRGNPMFEFRPGTLSTLESGHIDLERRSPHPARCAHRCGRRSAGLSRRQWPDRARCPSQGPWW